MCFDTICKLSHRHAPRNPRYTGASLQSWEPVGAEIYIASFLLRVRELYAFNSLLLLLCYIYDMIYVIYIMLYN